MSMKRIMILLSGLALLLGSASACLAGEYLSGTISNVDWKPYYGRGATREEAVNAAVMNCGNSDYCRQEAEVVSSGQCIALVDSDESVAMAWGPDPRAAVEDAMKRCTDNNNTNCHFISMECAR